MLKPSFHPTAISHHHATFFFLSCVTSCCLPRAGTDFLGTSYCKTFSLAPSSPDSCCQQSPVWVSICIHIYVLHWTSQGIHLQTHLVEQECAARNGEAFNPLLPPPAPPYVNNRREVGQSLMLFSVNEALWYCCRGSWSDKLCCS